MVFQCINICQVPWKVLKTMAFGLSFQHLKRDLANVNAWKAMFDPYIDIFLICLQKHVNHQKLLITQHICAGWSEIFWYVQTLDTHFTTT